MGEGEGRKMEREMWGEMEEEMGGEKEEENARNCATEYH